LCSAFFFQKETKREDAPPAAESFLGLQGCALWVVTLSLLKLPVNALSSSRIENISLALLPS
jgi:hypothetical protein